MPLSSVSVRVPATSANLGPGFDCLGMALDIWATITLSKDAAEAAHPLAANALAGVPFDREQLLLLATELEGHADNAAPALFGGLQVVVRDRQRLTHVGVPLPRGLKAVLLVPELRMPTQKSRKLLPQSLSRTDAVQNASRAALVVAAFSQGRLDLLDE